MGNAQRMDEDGDESKETFADELRNGNSKSSKNSRTANKAVTWEHTPENDSYEHTANTLTNSIDNLADNLAENQISDKTDSEDDGSYGAGDSAVASSSKRWRMKGRKKTARWADEETASINKDLSDVDV